MNAFKKLYFLLIIIPVTSFANDVSDVFVQQNGQMIKFTDAVQQAKGSIVSTSQPLKYSIDVNGRRGVVNFYSKKDIREELSFFYPDHIVLQIDFLKVNPNTEAYFDNSLIATIDKNGNSISSKFPISEPGKHIVKLKNAENTIASTELDIPVSSLILCSGKLKFQCKIN